MMQDEWRITPGRLDLMLGGAHPSGGGHRVVGPTDSPRTEQAHSPLLTEKDTCAYLRVSKRNLDCWRRHFQTLRGTHRNARSPAVPRHAFADSPQVVSLRTNPIHPIPSTNHSTSIHFSAILIQFWCRGISEALPGGGCQRFVFRHCHSHPFPSVCPSISLTPPQRQWPSTASHERTSYQDHCRNACNPFCGTSRSCGR